ncbi:hypothetical protein ACEZDB_25570 [Streptacidiphilus sp. N1-3]|uniref:Uncharacterized protein n=1 Tax=Streptacidiphilus alkalitolerans TaxID=3342712 RepID=A0ABV6X6X4_9ACTN
MGLAGQYFGEHDPEHQLPQEHGGEAEKLLDGVGVNKDSMYPPLSEVRRLARKVAKDAVSQSL